MKTIYLDTTTSYLYFGVLDNGVILDEVAEYMGNEMSIKVLPIINKVLKKNNIDIKEITKIMVVNGPGSFTGTRIGLTIAKTLAWSLKIPIVTISSLEAMAISYDLDKKVVAPIIDARRGFVYGGVYDFTNYTFILNEQYIELQELLKKTDVDVDIISNDKFENVHIVTYKPNIERIVRHFSDREPINHHEVDANYLKLTEAEEKLNI